MSFSSPFCSCKVLGAHRNNLLLTVEAAIAKRLYFLDRNIAIASWIWRSQSTAEIAAIDFNLEIVRTLGKIPSDLHL